MEDYAGDNHPYRGTENHGVADTAKPHDPDVYGLNDDEPDGIPVSVLVHEEKTPDPVPVRIVTEYKKEIHRFGTDRVVLDFTTANNAANRPVEIVGRSENRTSIKLRNMDPTNWVYIGGTREEVAMRGYPITPGSDVTLSAEEPIFAVVVKPDGTFPNASATLAYIAEYVVKGG
jgi:hypothetical protein